MNVVARHLARALEQHRRWCRDQAIPWPAELDQLLSIVSGGQDGTKSLTVGDLPDDAGVPIALTYDEAGRLLECSARTIRRLVTEGKLRSITVGAAPRIARTELERFVEDQMAEPQAVNQ